MSDVSNSQRNVPANQTMPRQLRHSAGPIRRCHAYAASAPQANHHASVAVDLPRDAYQHNLPMSIREVAKLYGSEKSLPVVKAHRPLSGLHFVALSALERRYLEYWESEDFLSRSRQASMNRNTEVEGPGTGPSKHDGGSMSFVTTNERLDDEEMYYNVASECPRGRVYGLGSLGRKKRRYADPGASTSQMPKMAPRSEFDSVAEQLRQIVAFMQSNSR
ncbi:hypothetical protein Syun_017592 [Stephania yunnanensis]|uniref:Uncharacterized protein n=1 Tax=Stephania yunnanensis TaxID=152371 RepID=A0AAP0J857_9MAGN